MILIIILIIISFYLFWHFERVRKRKNARQHEGKREAFRNLLQSLQEQDAKKND